MRSPFPGLVLAVLACGPARVPPAAPARADTAAARLAASTRHGEWAAVPGDTGDTIRVWLVYPERPDAAPVVVVVHDTAGLTTAVRADADRLAAGGFIAVAPDLTSAADEPEAMKGIVAAGAYGTALPAATDRWGIVGFGWGGWMARATAAATPAVGAAVAFSVGVGRDGDEAAAVGTPTLVLPAGAERRDGWPTALEWLRGRLER